MEINKILDRGKEIAALVETADDLEQLRTEWKGYRQEFFRLAREAEARACVDLLNFFEGVADAIDLAIIKRRKKIENHFFLC